MNSVLQPDVNHMVTCRLSRLPDAKLEVCCHSLHLNAGVQLVFFWVHMSDFLGSDIAQCSLIGTTVMHCGSVQVQVHSCRPAEEDPGPARQGCGGQPGG